MFQNRKSSMCIAAAALCAIVGATAAQGASLAYSNFDTRSQGSFTAVATPSNDADGSLRLQTNDASSEGKVSVLFYQPSASPLGTLGDLQGVSVDMFKSSTPATPAPNTFAFRLNLGTSGGQPLALVWENNYNGNSTVALDEWINNFGIAAGNFWQRGNGANFNGGAQAVTLQDWVNGHTETMDGNGAAVNSVVLSASTPVYGLEIAYGSSVGAFTGYIDDVTLTFGGPNAANFNANIAVPEPATIGVIGISCLGLLARRRRTV